MTLRLRAAPSSRPALADAARLAELHATGLLHAAGAPAQPTLDGLTRLAARLLGAPTALVSLVDVERQVLVSGVGLPEPWATARETPLSHSVCQHVVASAGPLAIEDARDHQLPLDGLALSELGVVAYAGMPLRTGTGHVLGSLCVIDGQPRRWSADDLLTLEELARAATAEIERQIATRRLSDHAAALAQQARDMSALLDGTAKSETALRTSEAEYRTLLASLPLIVYRVAPHPPYMPQYVSPGVSALGYTLDEWLAIPDRWLRVLHEDDRARVLAATDAALTAGVAVDYEYRVHTKDGSVRWIHDRGDFVRDASGAPVAWQGIMLDVTAQRLAEDALRESAARLDLIYNSATDLFFLMRVERDAAHGAITYRCESVNEAYLRVTGLAREALIGRTLPEILPTQAAAYTRSRYDEAVRTGGVQCFDETVELPGGVLVVETTLTPVLDDAGRCTHLLGVARDVTGTRRAEAVLREREARFRGVLEHLRAPAVQLDAAGRISFANAALLTLTEWSHQEALGADWFAHYVPDGAVARTLFEESLRTGIVPIHHEGELLTRHGERRTVAWDHVTLRDGDDTIVGIASVGQDITERRALERRLAALSEHDELTGLLNRRGFNRLASHALKSATRSRRHDAVLYIDLDRFKPINDTYGHAAGDDALRSVADLLRATLRDADFAARLGGDEFAVFAVGLHQGEGHVIAARLRATLHAHNAAATAAGRPFRIELSVGVAEVEPGDELEALLARADGMLYAQKLARRGQATAGSPLATFL